MPLKFTLPFRRPIYVVQPLGPHDDGHTMHQLDVVLAYLPLAVPLKTKLFEFDYQVRVLNWWPCVDAGQGAPHLPIFILTKLTD